MSEQTSQPVVYQLQLQPKHRPTGLRYHVEVVYKWCSVHSIAYSTRIEKNRGDKKVPRNYGECPLCWRERMRRERKE